MLNICSKCLLLDYPSPCDTRSFCRLIYVCIHCVCSFVILIFFIKFRKKRENVTWVLHGKQYCLSEILHLQEKFHYKEGQGGQQHVCFKRWMCQNLANASGVLFDLVYTLIFYGSSSNVLPTSNRFLPFTMLQ